MKTGCVILAGGKSSRMGEDKALLEYDGQIFIKKIADELSFFDEKIIARGNNCALTDMENDSWKIISDEYPEHGPIGGLHASLKSCESEAMFCVSCDIPFVKGELAQKMSNAMNDDFDAVIAVTADGKFHPLCGVYRKELYHLMKEHILQDNNRMMAVLRKVRVKYVNLEEVTSKQLMNVNTKEEYDKLKKL